MCTRFLSGALILLVTLGCMSLHARIRYVPDDYESIQAGIDAAQEGDTVLVQPDIYLENLDFNGKNITVASLYLLTLDDSFIANTIVDGDSVGRVVIFRNGENSEAVLCGFTLRNGLSNYGGGIYINADNGSCTPTLDHLLITGNESRHFGGGIYCTHNADPILRHVTVSGNTAANGNGGLATFDGASANINGCIFWGNSPSGLADGLTINYSDIEGGYGGAGNINADPAWIDPGNGNYHLTEDSPCIDVADPGSPDDRDGSRADMGVFFYNQGNVHIFVVPDEFGTIQEAIDNAADDDTVLVYPGTYTENVDFSGKDILVVSLYLVTGDEDYLHETIIDGGGSGSVVTFTNGETSNAILRGFTIRNGQSNIGGGILCSNASPRFELLEIENNTAQRGGGLYLSDSNPVLYRVSIILNN